MKNCLLFLLVISFTAFYYPQVKSGSINNKSAKQNSLDTFKKLEQTAGRKLNIELSQNNTPAIVEGRLTLPGYSRSANKDQDAVRFLSENKDLFRLSDPYKELSVKSVEKDELQMTHVKFDQTINGLRIFPSQIIVHINADGSVESVNGNYIPTPSINTVPSISSSSAINFAKSYLGKYTADKELCEAIVLRNGISLSLVYEVRLPNKFTPNMKVYVDAENGKLISIDDGIRYDGPSNGSGVGLTGSVRQLNTYYLKGQYYLIDASLPMYQEPIDSLFGVIACYNAQNDTNNQGYDKATLVYDPNKDNNFNDNTSLRASVEAQYYTQIVYNFYKSHYSRNSIDNKGGSLVNVVHYKQDYNNAFWNGICMSYGDGDGTNFTCFAGALDVIGHELTHGVTEHSADLVYHKQSGAINEHMSDVFGVLVDSTDWLIGEDIFTPDKAGDAVRNMQDPHNDSYKGDYKWQPAHMDEFVTLDDDKDGDWGGVHVNSGIPNKAFYNVASVISVWKAGRIWYRALTEYLTANSQFSDLRISCLASAKDLYGETSAEYNAVKSGFDNVGINSNSGGNTTDLIYDDDNPDSYIWETDANWKIANKFTAPVSKFSIQNVKVYIAGEYVSGGNGHFTLELFKSNSSGLPGGASLITPFSHIPTSTGWLSFNVTGVETSGDFFLSILYDGTNCPELGADAPPGNGRAYEYDPAKGWYRLTGDNEYTIFMRATIKTVTAVAEIETRIPKEFEVLPNYPNPFNPSTTIKYSLPKETYVKIKIYDINGNLIADLADNHQNAGTYTITWNGKNNNGADVSSGVYYFRINAGGYSHTNKMLLLK